MDKLGRLQVRNVMLLSLSWACSVGAIFLLITNGIGLARQLQGDSVATLPAGILFVFATLTSLSAPQVTHLISKRSLFMLASTSGVVGGALMCVSAWKGSLPLLCLSGAPQGIAYGISNLYRFFAVDTTLPQHREKALAAVVGGAVLSAFIGPEAGRHLRLALDQEFLGPFVLNTCLWVAQFILISSVDYTAPAVIAAAAQQPSDASAGIVATAAASAPEKALNNSSNELEAGLAEDNVSLKPTAPAEARPWHEIALSVDFLTGASIASITFFTMAGLMSATPLAMADVGRSVDASTLVIEAHLVAMYLPSFFSGDLVGHFTAGIMLVPGTLLLLLGSAILFVNTNNVIFFTAMILIGTGWNFSYVASSNLLLKALQSPLEKPIAQGMFDAVALGGLSSAGICSGFMFDGLGWRNMYTVNMSLNAAACVIAGLYGFCRAPTAAKA